MNKTVLYSHGGSGNHGCEAIVRGTYKILDKQIDELYSYKKDEDIEYGLNKLLEIKNHLKCYSHFSLKRIKASLLIRIFQNEEYSEKITYDALFKSVKKGDIAISIGGDNYCYGSFGEYTLCNKYLTRQGVKTILWGCSIEPSKIDKNMEKDLMNYDYIFTRESITFNKVKTINNNTYLYPDPAFQLDKIDLDLPKNFIKGNTVGINVSPLIMSCESNKGITKENYIQLIDYIIKETDMNIALIPHVVWENNDDRKPLKELYDIFKDTNRVCLIDDHNCMELKGYISRCRFFVGARTHATIAAYSTCVPTLVVGYSVKAKGIAKDIFGTYDNYVLPVQSLKEKDDLTKSFKWIINHETEIKKHLDSFIPEYKAKALDAGIKLKEMVGV